MGVINTLFQDSKGNTGEILFVVDSISQIEGTDGTKAENVSFPCIARLVNSNNGYLYDFGIIIVN